MIKLLVYWFLGVLAIFLSCKATLKSTLIKSEVSDSFMDKIASDRLEKLKLSDLSGRQVRLSDYAGKPIFLNFWATWCKPCRSEMATIEEISKQFKDEIIFLLASDEDTSKIQSYLSENKFDLHFIHMDVPFIDAYITELPTTFLIDRKGNLVSEEEGFRIWTDPGNVENLKKLGTKN